MRISLEPRISRFLHAGMIDGGTMAGLISDEL